MAVFGPHDSRNFGLTQPGPGPPPTPLTDARARQRRLRPGLPRPTPGLLDVGAVVQPVGNRGPGIVGDLGDDVVGGLVEPDGNRTALALLVAGVDDLVVVEARVGAQRDRPLAPARRARLIVSATKLAAPRPELATPSRSRECSTSPLPATVASSGW